MDIIEKVGNYIDIHKLLHKVGVIIIGFSGGPDSVALYGILHELGYSCVLAHCNFHLRGEESNRDQYFVESFAKLKGVKLYSTHFATENYAKEHGLSLEMAARDLRYGWFSSLQKEINAQAIAIAHHSDDSIETFFINLLRGTSIHGLTGIKPKNQLIVRPLLCVSRKEILDYLSSRNENYVIDSTNLENDFLRNKIRNQLIPLLTEISPNCKQSIQNTIFNLQKNLSFYSKTIKEIGKYAVSESDGSILIDLKVIWNHEDRETLLFELLKQFGCNTQMIVNILNCDLMSSGQIFKTKTHVITKNRGFLEIVSEEETSIEPGFLNGFGEYDLYGRKLTIKEENSEDLIILKDKNHCYVDADKITFPLSVRKWENGDCFYPFGMNNLKKLSDFFVNEKLSLHQKKSLWIIETKEHQIVWIVGLRPDNRFRVTANTKKIIHLCYSEL